MKAGRFLHRYQNTNLSKDFYVLFRSFQIFCIGVSALQRFIQSNWLGFNEFENSVDRTMDNASKECLILDGESLVPTMKDLQLLLVAKTILCDLKEQFIHFEVCIYITKKQGEILTYFLCFGSPLVGGV